MSKGLFITATGTDIGKTYVAALIVKKLREAGKNAGYYKAALSGADCIKNSDAGYVNKIAKIGQKEDTLLSYLYENAVSPHLASMLEGNPVELDRVQQDYRQVQSDFDYVTVEGSGGIVCPIRWDGMAHILLEDIIQALGLQTLIVADAGLGTINAVALTAAYLKSRKIGIKGVVLNHYQGTVMQQDNIKMIEEITKLPILALVKKGDSKLDMDADLLAALYE